MNISPEDEHMVSKLTQIFSASLATTKIKSIYNKIVFHPARVSKKEEEEEEEEVLVLVCEKLELAQTCWQAHKMVQLLWNNQAVFQRQNQLIMWLKPKT